MKKLGQRTEAAAALAVACLVTALAAQDEPALVRLHSGSGGTIPIAGAAVLRLEGLAGTLVLRGGRPGELRYEARSLDDRREPRTVVVDRHGSSELRLAHADPQDRERLLVEVAVAPELALEVEARDSRLVVSGIGGTFDLHGERLDVDVRGNYGPVRIEIADAKLKLDLASSDVEVRGRGLEVELRNVGGMLALALEASRASVDGVARDAGIELDETELALAHVRGAVQLRARDGAVALREPASDVELRLDGTRLELVGAAGTVRVETDADVQFKDVAGFLTIESYGGAVRGTGGSGQISVSTSQAEVTLEQVGGAAHIRGDGLRVRVVGAKAGVQLEVVSSEVVLQDVAGAASVTNEFGDVSVVRATGGLRVTSRNGRVHVEGARGAVEVRADGDEATVEWAEMAKDGEQLVENASGTVQVRLPARVVCRVEAESSFGQVISAFGAVKETGERSAAGNLNGGTQPLVRIRAGGDIEIAVADAAAR